MSTIVLAFYDQYYAKHKDRIDRDIRSALDVDTIAHLVKTHPKATDEELLALATKHLDIGIDGWPVDGFDDLVIASRPLQGTLNATEIRAS